MFDAAVIFQRTLIGRDEIYEKKRGLTQSERLVLIMIDGATSYQGVRAKLPVLAAERFNRALLTLQKKELISEVFLPVEGQAPEAVEQTVIDRFIQQDPTDPLTIISFDPEEDFGVFGPPVAVPAMTPGTASMPATAEVGNEAMLPEATMDQALIEQAESLAQEVRARRPQYENPIAQVRDFSVPRRPPVAPQPTVPAHATPARLQWSYWLIGTGLAFIIGFLVARLVH